MDLQNKRFIHYIIPRKEGMTVMWITPIFVLLLAKYTRWDDGVQHTNLCFQRPNFAAQHHFII